MNMIRSVVLFSCLWQATALSAGNFAINVVDEAGKPVPTFEIMWHTGDSGYSRWKRCEKGYWRESCATRSNLVDLIIRADGFASKVQRFEWNSLRDGRASMQLERGQEVTIENIGQDQAIPKDFVMDSFFTDYAKTVHMMWSPVNNRGEKADWNMLNVRQVDDKHFTFRVSPTMGKFVLALQHPGWLRFCEFGPYTPEKVATGELKIDIPRPARIKITFDPNSSEAERPFRSQTCDVYWVPDESGAVINVVKDDVPIDPQNPVVVTDLAPGKYMIQVRTQPSEQRERVDPTDINLGAFFDGENIALKSGQDQQIDFKWVPFNPQKHQGKANAELTIVSSDGSVPANRKIQVTWFDGHYGSLKVFEGPLTDNGVINLKGLSTMRHRIDSPFGLYRISMDGEWLGFFNLEDTTETQKFKFAAAPKAGDVAPDIELIDIESKQAKKLSDFKGQIVVLEFWATWCGPCQPAMSKLDELAKKMPDGWKNKVALISLSTDHEPEVVSNHVSARDWKGLKHYHAKRDGDQYFSDAEVLYGVNGIPHAFLIDEKGIVRWSGHPITDSQGPQLVDRVDELLK